MKTFKITTSTNERYEIDADRMTFGSSGSVWLWKRDRKIAYFFAPAVILEL